jgi:hypothetical protein
MVGDWVAQHAGEALQDRRRRVEAVERASADLGHVGPGASSAAASAEFVGPTSNRSFVPTAEAAELSASGSATSRSSNLTVSNSAAYAGHSTFRQIVVALFLGAVAVGILGGIWYWQQHVFEDADPGPSTATLPEPPADVAPVPSREPVRGATSAADKGGTPPPMVEIDSLPETTDDPDAGASAGALAGVEQGRNLAPTRTRRAGRRANHTARASAGTPPKGARPSVTAPADSAAQNPECSPPWYIDGKGIQRLKPKCLE